MANIRAMPGARDRWIMQSCARQALAIGLALGVYVSLASSRPVSIAMWQTYDDALFIRLARHIADGQWLGPYNQLTLVKGPIFPLFLAGLSATGLPFDIAEYGFYFLCCLYFSWVVFRLCGKDAAVGVSTFICVLLCPASNLAPRIARESVYCGLTLLLFALAAGLLLVERPARRGLLALATGFTAAIYWLAREEGAWIAASMLILLGAAAWRRARRGIAEQVPLLRLLAAAALSAALVVSTIGLLNLHYYGRFVLVEMKDSAFQRALADLERVGSTFGKPYLPVPRAARQLIYAESPSFAELRGYLDPKDGDPPPSQAVACAHFAPGTCGDAPGAWDIPGSWFMWALRDAVGRLDRVRSAAEAADFYAGLSREVESACSAGRLPCAAWLPPLVPPIPAAQLRTLPDALARAALLLFYIPGPGFGDKPSSLEAPDAAAAVAFLNRPFGFAPDAGDQPPSRLRALLRSAWYALLRGMVWIDRLLLGFGIGALAVLAVVFPRDLMRPAAVLVAALWAAVLSRIALLALVDISSFPSIFHVRMSPADPLALAAAAVTLHILAAAVRRRRVDVIDSGEREA